MTGDLSTSIVQESLQRLWKQVLPAGTVGPGDDFFRSGGDIKSGVLLMRRIADTFEVTLPTSVLLTHPTCGQLATLIGRHQAKRVLASIVPIRRGESGANIFLLHDGDGDVLCYRPLALRLSAEHTVYGVRAKSDGVNPIIQTRCPDIVEYYAEQILSANQGQPVVVGGLCIGGFLAFQVAKLLVASGVDVRLVALIDSPYVGSPKRQFVSFGQDVEDAWSTGSKFESLSRVSQAVYRKVVDKCYVQAIKNPGQVLALRYLLDHGLPVPKSLQQVSVDTVLRFAEQSYHCDTAYDASPVVLFRATGTSAVYDPKSREDRPYADLYEDPTLGWSNRAKSFACVDITGGHFTALREGQVQELASHFQRYLDQALM